MPSLRILHVIDSAGMYGAEAVLLALADGMRGLGHASLIASIGTTGAPEKALEREARARGLEVRQLRMRPGPNPAGVVGILSLVTQERIDLIHSHGYKGNILLAWIPRRLRRVPVVATVHGYTDTGTAGRLRVYNWLDRRALGRLDRVVLVHEDMAAGPDLAPRRTDRWAVIENGVDALGTLPPIAADDPICTFCRRRPTVGVLARLSPEKGHHILFRAFRLLLDRGYDVGLVVLGEGGERSALERMSAELNFADRVLFAGYVKDARRYLPLLTACTLPSFTEGLPIVLLEAMQAGVPVVATRVGSMATVLSDGLGGILVNPGDVAGLADGLSRLLDDAPYASELTRWSRAAVESRFSNARMVQRYEQLYSAVLQEGCRDIRDSGDSGRSRH